MHPPEHAFEVWTSRTSTWWPSSHSVSGDPGLTVTIEREVGGRILERTAQGEEYTWGEILAWDPPASFSYRWHLNEDVADATVVLISFEPFDESTEVTIVHGWEQLGPKGSGLQNGTATAGQVCSRTSRRRARLDPTVTERLPYEVMSGNVTGTGTPDDPWILQTPSLQSQFQMVRDPDADPPALICTVGSTELRYHLRVIEDLHAMLVAHGDWMPLGNADEQKSAKEGTVEAWARDPDNPVGGWYGLKKGLRGRFGMYVPPLMEALGLAELEHNARDNRTRAI